VGGAIPMVVERAMERVKLKGLPRKQSFASKFRNPMKLRFPASSKM